MHFTSSIILISISHFKKSTKLNYLWVHLYSLLILLKQLSVNMTLQVIFFISYVVGVQVVIILFYYIKTIL